MPATASPAEGGGARLRTGTECPRLSHSSRGAGADQAGSTGREQTDGFLQPGLPTPGGESHRKVQGRRQDGTKPSPKTEAVAPSFPALLGKAKCDHGEETKPPRLLGGP